MKKNILLILLSIIIIFASFSPQIIHLLNTPRNRTFTGFTAGGYSDDYNYYLSVIKQGIDGNNFVVDKYTNEPHLGNLMHLHYLLIGKIGAVLNFQSSLSYQIARILSGIIFLIITFFFVKYFANEKLFKTAFILVLFSSPWFFLNFDAKNWWQIIISSSPEPHPLYRFSTQPHFILASIYTLVTIMIFSKINNKFKIITLKTIAFLLFSAYTALADPAQTIVTSFTILLFLLPTLSKFKSHLSSYILFILNSIFVFIPMVYLKLVREVSPWKQISSFDAIQSFPNFKDFILSFGPSLIFAAIAVIFLIVTNLTKKPINQKIKTPLILITWIFSSIILTFFLSAPLNINRLRIFHTPIFIPISIFSAYGIYLSAELLFKKFKINKITTKSAFLGTILCFSIAIIISTLISNFNNIDKNSLFVFADNKQIEAFNFLDKNTKKEDTVICLYEACTQIPFNSGNTSFIGNITGTINERYKNELSFKIFSGIYKNNELKKILKENNIKYIFSGYQEKSLGEDFKKNNFINPIFTNQSVTIYKINY